MKSLIIPDIHTKWQKADSIVKKYKDVDEIVLLGDYFDDFGDSPKLNGRTAQWLKEEVLYNDKVTAILGNHEFNYLYNKSPYQCSGYSSSKKWKINQIMTSKDWYQLKPYYIAQGWYCTHAGITAPLCIHPVKGWDPEYFEKMIDKAMSGIPTGLITKEFSAGQYRGGVHAYGGINWCHFPNEFQAINGVKQVFGHTPGKEPRQHLNTDNWCLDTHLHHVGLIEDGELKVIPV